MGITETALRRIRKSLEEQERDYAWLAIVPYSIAPVGAIYRVKQMRFVGPSGLIAFDLVPAV